MITVIFATVLAASMAGQMAVGRVPGAVALPAGCAEEASPPDRRWR